MRETEPHTLALTLSRSAGEGTLSERRHNRVPSTAKRERFRVRACDSVLRAETQPALSHRQASFSSAAVFPTVARQAGSLPGGMETAMRVV